MAWRMKLRLPAFKVTQRCSGGVVSHFKASRPSSSQPLTVEDSKNFSDHTEHNAVFDDDCGCSDGDDYQGDKWQPDYDFLLTSESLSNDVCSEKEPSLHEIKQKRNVQAWGKLRPALLKCVVESSALSSKQCCLLCENIATYRCVQCAPWAYYCSCCFGKAHSKINIFHIGEIWQDGVYKPVIQEDRVVDVRPAHCCSTSKSVHLCCIDVNGAEHKISFVCCHCEPLPVTMARAHLWPSSPEQPHLAYTFELLDWFEALLLECQVALKDLCKALYFKYPHLISKRKDIYAGLIDSFEEYRYMKVELRHLNFLNPELDIGNVCPACPKESGNLILSMDALFGLPRKKSAGKSYRSALHGHIFFGNQQSVDEFVESSGTMKMRTKECSDFVAGDALRSSQ